MLMLLCVTFKTVSTNSLLIISCVLPIELKVLELSVKIYFKLSLFGLFLISKKAAHSFSVLLPSWKNSLLPLLYYYAEDFIPTFLITPGRVHIFTGRLKEDGFAEFGIILCFSD